MTRRAVPTAFLLFAAALFVVGPAEASRTTDARSSLASSSSRELASLELSPLEPADSASISSRFGFAEDLSLLDVEACPCGFELFGGVGTKRCALTYARNNPLKYVDPDGRLTFLVFHGRGYTATELKGTTAGNDVGRSFQLLAQKRKAEIEKSKSFNSKKDKVLVLSAGKADEFIKGMNAKYASGDIKGVDVFSHAYPGGLNLGEGAVGDPSKRFELSDLANLTPQLAPGARMGLFGCNTGVGSPSIAQALSDRLGIPVTGAPSTTRLKGAGDDLAIVPDHGDWVTFGQTP